MAPSRWPKDAPLAMKKTERQEESACSEVRERLQALNPAVNQV
jgi:hypothetical protein